MGASSANFPNRPFRLEMHTGLVSQSGNQSQIQTAVWVNKNSASPTYDFNPSYYAVYTGGALVGQGSFTFDFRNSDSLLIHVSNNWFNHDANGFLTTTSDAQCNASTLGVAEVAYSESWPRIPKPALAPTNLGIDQITPTSMRYRFGGNDLRGGTLQRWEHQYSTAADFSGGIIGTSNGTAIVTGLLPATRYYFRSRAVTNVGNGAWSAGISDVTLPSVRVSDGAAWITPQLLVSNGTAWVAPQLQLSKDSAWVTPAN